MTTFILNKKLVQTDQPKSMTLVDFLRDHKALKGTKIGCREGDCGACTVLVGEMIDDQVKYRTITSCISPLGNAHGKHIVTIEGINPSAGLSVAQAAIKDSNGTQCGFCTPGFVVSLTGMALESNRNEKISCQEAISGNICRCTGYKSIEKAAKQVQNSLPKVDHQHNIQHLIDGNFIPAFFLEIPDLLRNLEKDAMSKNGRIVAHGTDLYVKHADQLLDEDIYLITQDKSLQYIRWNDHQCTFGANTTVADIQHDARFNSTIPDLTDYIKLVSSQPIRNMASIAGNFVNASPIGDMTIFFLALDAKIKLRKANQSKREIALNRFHQDYKKYDLSPGEIIESITFNSLTNKELYNFEKVSKRTHLDIASVNSAMKIEHTDGYIQGAHLAIGGVAAIPKYMFETNAYLVGKPINANTIIQAEQIIQSEIAPISDVRGHADYKRMLARQLFFAHFIKWFPEQIQLEKLFSI